MPSQPRSSNWQTWMPAYMPTPNWQPPIPSHLGDAGLCDPNMLEPPRRVQRPSVYIQSPYTPFPATTELPKKRVGKTKKNSKNDNLSPLNLGNAFAHDDVGGHDVLITGVHHTEIFWRQLEPHLVCQEVTRQQRRQSPTMKDGLSVYQMNAWIEILIRSRPQDVDWTVSKSGTACVHPKNNQFIIQTDPHIIGTLDGSTRPYPSWKNVNWVYMPINVGGNHRVTSAVNLPHSIFYVVDSMER
ncbi:phospholipase-like protein [Tanacetum coccineum]